MKKISNLLTRVRHNRYNIEADQNDVTGPKGLVSLGRFPNCHGPAITPQRLNWRCYKTIEMQLRPYTSMLGTAETLHGSTTHQFDRFFPLRLVSGAKQQLYYESSHPLRW